MSTVLRRACVPRVKSVPRQVNADPLPTFLNRAKAIPMTPEHIMGPPDALERAIMAAQVWDDTTAPIEFATFNAEEDVISVLVEQGDGTLVFDIKEGHDGVQILANGKPMAHIAQNGTAFSAAHLRVLQARS